MRVIWPAKLAFPWSSSANCLLLHSSLLPCATFITCSQGHGEVCRSDSTQRVLTIEPTLPSRNFSSLSQYRALYHPVSLALMIFLHARVGHRRVYGHRPPQKSKASTDSSQASATTAAGQYCRKSVTLRL